MNNIIKLDFISDSGHAWIKVNKNIFKKYNIDIKKISNYSYKDDNHYYLEEDCDAIYFINELKKRNVEISIYENMVEETHIRSLNRINY